MMSHRADAFITVFAGHIMIERSMRNHPRRVLGIGQGIQINDGVLRAAAMCTGPVLLEISRGAFEINAAGTAGFREPA